MSSRAASVPLRRVLLSSWEYDPNIVGGMGRHVTELIQAMGEELPDSTYEIHLLTPACPKAPEYEKIGETGTCASVSLARPGKRRCLR